MGVHTFIKWSISLGNILQANKKRPENNVGNELVKEGYQKLEQMKDTIKWKRMTSKSKRVVSAKVHTLGYSLSFSISALSGR